MGQLPAVIIVARQVSIFILVPTYLGCQLMTFSRHGARLDAADNQWHLTSPTPYDPPLTYGGWTQSRALGARIASFLHARETSYHERPSTSDGHLSPVVEGEGYDVGTEGGKSKAVFPNERQKRRKHKVILHTSPYLRCLQTSIAISAGMAQYYGTFRSTADSEKRQPSPRRSKSPVSSALESLTSVQQGQQQGQFFKPVLRVDAFLGEWLNPDYFELITPPPNSVMMVTGAKAELLRREEYTDLEFALPSGTSPVFPGGWGSAIDVDDNLEAGPLSSLSSLIQALPRRDRTSSHSVAGNYGSRTGQRGSRLLKSIMGNGVGYVAPTPAYAISSSDPIPRGYVAHARDACVEVDYQWDSTRDPPGWGNGGDYGEEWGIMHRRCRKALQKMLSWYKTNDSQEVKKGVSKDDFEHDHGDDDTITDTVLILVSHGAACNAFIGGLTDSPVLLDVGMASFTLALRKETALKSSVTSRHKAQTSTPSPPPSLRRMSSMTLPASADYEVKLIASTDHLRPGSSHLTIPQLQTSNVSPTSQSPHRQRDPSSSSAIEDEKKKGSFGFERATRSATSSALGSMRRRSQSSSPIPPLRPPISMINNTPAGGGCGGDLNGGGSGGGLWSRPTSSGGNGGVIHESESESQEGDDMVLSFHHTTTTTNGEHPPPSAKIPNISQEKRFPVPITEGINTSQRGLWGSSAETTIATEREKGAKRRWTTHEQGS